MNMIFKLIKKEAILNYNISTVIWCICAIGMYFIPNYPSYIGMFYILLAMMMIFQLGQGANDIVYSVLLPVRKVDTVSARFLYCALLEVGILVVSLIACFIRKSSGYPVNMAGIGLNVAYYGLQMIILSIVNIVFLGNVYKNPVKVGKPFLVSSILYFVLYAICELPIWVYNAMVSNLEKEGFDPEIAATEVLIDKPAIALERIGAYIKAMDGAGQLKQLPILIAGIVIYAITWVIVYKRACKQFQAYDI